MPAVTRVPGQYYSIHDDTIQDMADAIRYRTGAVEALTPAEMIEELEKRYLEDLDIEPYGITGDWVRPSDWPDLDSLNLEMSGSTDFVYMTYDADSDDAHIAWHIDTSSGKATIDIGHIENGTYVVDETAEVSSGTNYSKSLEEYSGYVVVRITGTITHCYGFSVTANGATVMPYRAQPVMERIAYIPHFTYLAPSSSYAWGMWSLEHEVISQGSSYGYALTSLTYAYAECARLRSLDISGVITPNVTSLSSTFNGCYVLKELDLKHWDVSKVTSFASCFYNCRALETLDLTGWDTAVATNFSSMFYECRRLAEIPGITAFKSDKITNLTSMFYGCQSLKEADVSGWKTPKITSLASVFAYCRSLITIDVSGWNVSGVTNLSSLFQECSSAKVIKMPSGPTGTLTTVNSMFSGCNSVQHLDVSWIQVTSACTNIYAMFNNCWSLKELDIPSTWNVTGIGSGSSTANSMFANCYSLERLTGIANWDFRFTNSLASMFSGCRSLKQLDVSGWNVSTVTSLATMFANCWALRELDLTSWAPSAAVTSYASMFAYCYSLKRIIGNLGSWITSGATTFASMFQDCLSLESLPELSSWNVAKATTVASMFSGCSSLREITIKNWNLAACTTIATMFRYCYNLRKVTLTGWSIPKVTSTAPAQFLGDCWNLEEVYIFPIPLNHSYTNCRCLSKESLLRIINSLPVVTTTRTINLTASNVNKLTAAEKAVATAKKWTIAN